MRGFGWRWNADREMRPRMAGCIIGFLSFVNLSSKEHSGTAIFEQSGWQLLYWDS